jgi:hypothetical protein
MSRRVYEFITLYRCSVTLINLSNGKVNRYVPAVYIESGIRVSGSPVHFPIYIFFSDSFLNALQFKGESLLGC